MRHAQIWPEGANSPREMNVPGLDPSREIHDRGINGVSLFIPSENRINTNYLQTPISHQLFLIGK
jgi:hypothetical protein